MPKGSFGLGAPMQKGERGMDRMRIASLGVSGGQKPVGPAFASSSTTPTGSGTRSVSSSAALGGRVTPRRADSDNDIASAGVSSPSLGARLSAIPRGLADVETESVRSISSLRVEAGSTGTAEGVPVGSARADPVSEPPSRSGSPRPEAADHATQVEQTRELLKQFEADEKDPVAKGIEGTHDPTVNGEPIEPPDVVEAAPTNGPADEPPRPSMEQDLGALNLDDVTTDVSPRPSEYVTSQEEFGGSEDGYSDILASYPQGGDDHPAVNGQPSPAGVGGQEEAPTDEAGMPKVKCSDCHIYVSMLELADHVCAPASASSAPASPATPRPNKTATLGPHASPSSPLATREPLTMRPPPKDVPNDDDLDSPSNTEAIDQAASRTPSADSSSFPSGPEDSDPDVPSTPDVPQTPEMPHHSAKQVLTPIEKVTQSASPRSPWMDEEDEQARQGGTGYVTIVRSSRG